MTPPSPISAVIVDTNLFRVGRASLPSADVSAMAILHKWSISSDTAFGWSAGPAFQFLHLPSSQSGETMLGVRSHIALAHRFTSHLKWFASAGLGVHRGTMSMVEGVGHGGLMFQRFWGLPDGMSPMVQGIAGMGVFFPQSGPVRYEPLYGGGLGVRWCF